VPAASLLEVRNLTVEFPGRNGHRRAVVGGIGYELSAGRTLGIVGESGCGKTMTALALIGLVPPPGGSPAPFDLTDAS